MMTKGPWKVGKSCHVNGTMDRHWYHVSHVCMADDFATNPCIAEVCHRGQYRDTEKSAHRPTEEQAANARAIAQVPAMVHFLRRIADGREYVRGYETGLALDELQVDARAILRAVEGK